MRKTTLVVFVAAMALSGVAMADQYSEIAKDSAGASQGPINPENKWTGFSYSDVYSESGKDAAQPRTRSARVKQELPTPFMWDRREDPYSQFNDRGQARG